MFITAAWMSPVRALPATRSVRGPAEWRKLAETSNKEQNAYQHLYDLRTSGFESLFSDSHYWKTALAQVEFNGDQNCLDQSGQQKRQKRSETSNQPSQHGHRISKTTVQSYIKQSRGWKLTGGNKSRKYPKNSKKRQLKTLKNTKKPKKNWRDEDIWQRYGVTSSSLSWDTRPIPKTIAFGLRRRSPFHYGLTRVLERGGRFCPPLLFFANIFQSIRSIAVIFSIPAQK